MKKLLREPLVHFLLLGAALFALFQLRGASADGGGGRIVVPAGRIEALSSGFARTWRRPPTQSELEGLVDEWIREEVLYREAIARGLDRDDAVVRRRLRQKLEFLADDLADLVEPTGDQLADWLATHADRFRRPPRLALRQVFVSPDRRGERAAADARELLEVLRGEGAAADIGELGDPLMLPAELELQPLDEIERVFGPGFGEDLLPLEAGTWQGPIGSSYGLHLVLVVQREEGHVPSLADVRDEVARDWMTAHREELAETFYQGLRARYEIAVEWPQPEPEQVEEATR
jgi:hypothetical protein